MRSLILLLLVTMVSNCADNIAAGTVEETKADEAKRELDNFQWDRAIALYTELIAEEPEEYGYLSLIATAHAGRAGVDILNIASQKLTGEGSVISKVSKFIPEDPTDQQIEDINSSVSFLQAIPADAGGENLQIARTAQLSVYLTVQSTMLINSFSSLTPTGQLDPETLDQMTADDADQILASLEAAATTTDDPKLQEKIDGVLAEIDSAEGGSREEKLKSFLQTQ